MSEEPRLSQSQIEEAGKFRIGDLVYISGTKPWCNDWRDVEAEVIGIEFDRAGVLDITLRHDGGQFTDGFAVDDLSLLRRALNGDTK